MNSIKKSDPLKGVGSEIDQGVCALRLMLNFRRFWRVDDANRLHPFINALGVFEDRRVGTAVAERVVRVGVDVHLSRNSHFSKLTIRHNRRHCGISVPVPVDEAHRGRLFVESEVFDEWRVVSPFGIFIVDAVFKSVGRIDGDRKISVAGEVVDRVDAFVSLCHTRRSGHEA